MAVLKRSLQALARKAELTLDFEELEDQLEDALEMRLGATLSEEGVRRLPKTMSLCHRVLAHRDVQLTAIIGSQTVTRRFAQGTSADVYKHAFAELCEALVDDRRTD